MQANVLRRRLHPTSQPGEEHKELLVGLTGSIQSRRAVSHVPGPVNNQKSLPPLFVNDYV